jgi:hypothetical protein
MQQMAEAQAAQQQQGQEAMPQDPNNIQTPPLQEAV